MQKDNFNRDINIIEESDNSITVIVFDEQGQEILRVNNSTLDKCMDVINHHSPGSTETSFDNLRLEMAEPPDNFVLVVLDQDKNIVEKITEEQVPEKNLGDYGIENLRFIELDERKLAFDNGIYSNNITFHLEILNESTASIKIDEKHLPFLKNQAMINSELKYVGFLEELDRLKVIDYNEQLKVYQHKLNVEKKKLDIIKIILETATTSEFLKQYSEANNWPTFT